MTFENKERQKLKDTKKKIVFILIAGRWLWIKALIYTNFIYFILNNISLTQTNMGKFRKAIASLSMVALLSTLVVSIGAFAAYEDVPATHWAYSYVTELETEGVLTPADKFRPNDPINRAEFGKMVVLKFGHEGGDLCSETFEDCKEGRWYDEVLGTAVAHDLLRGDGEGMMRPEGNINRAEAMTVIHRAAGEPTTEKNGSAVFSDVSSGSWYDVSVGWGYCYVSIDGFADGTFGSSKNLTRAAAAKMIAEGAAPSAEPRAACLVDDDDPVVPAGDLTVSAGVAPSYTYVPSKSTLVEWATFNFTAEESVVIESLTLTRSELGSRDDFDGGYLYSGDTRLSNKKNVTTDNKIEFTGLSIAVPAGHTKAVTLRMNADSTGGSEGVHRFSIASATDIGTNSTGSVLGNFPVEGAALAYSTVEAATLTLANVASTSNKKVGETGVVLNEFTVVNNNKEKVEISRVIMRQNGTAADSALSAVYLEIEGARVMAEGVSMVGKYIDMKLDEPYVLDKTETVTLTVKGDVVSEIGKTVALYVKDATDFEAYGLGYGGKYSALLSNGLNTTTATASTVTIEGSDINVSFDGPIATEVKANTKGLVLANFNILASEDSVNIDTLRVVLEMGAATAGEQLENLVMRDTLSGVSYTVADPSVGSSANLDFENIYLRRGQEYKFEIKGDIPSGVTGGQTYKVSIDFSAASGDFEADGTAFGVSNFSTSTLTGKLMTVADPTVTIQPVSTTAATYVPDAKGVLLYKGRISANRVSDLSVSKMTFEDVAGTIANFGDAFDRMSLYVVEDGEAETKLDDETSLSGVTSVVFSGFNLTVPKGTSNYVTFVVRGDVKGSPTAGTVLLRAKAAATADYTVRDADNTLFLVGQYTVSTTVGQTTTIAEKGDYTISLDITGTGTNVDKYVVAGQQASVGRLRLTATREAAILEKLTLERGSSGTATSDDVSKVTLYANEALTEEIASISVNSSHEAVFEDLGIEIPTTGVKYVYIGADVKPIDYSASPGSNATATAGKIIEFEIDSAEAKGSATGEILTFKGDNRATAATQTVTFANDWANGDTAIVIIGGNTVTLTSTTAGTTKSTWATELAAKVNADDDASALVTASASGDVVTLTAVEKGTNAHAITVATTGTDTAGSGTLAAGAGTLASGADAQSKKSTILGARLENLTSAFAGGVLGNGIKDIFSFEVEVEDSDNVDYDSGELAAKLSQVNFTVTKNSGITVSSPKITRLFGSNGEKDAKAFGQTITISGATDGDFIAVIDGKAATFTASSNSVAQITDGLAAAINNLATLDGIAAAYSNGTSVITVYSLTGDNTVTIANTGSTTLGEITMGGAALSATSDSNFCGGDRELIPVNFALTYGTDVDLEVNPGDEPTYLLTATLSGVGASNSLQTTIESVNSNVSYTHNTGTAGVKGADLAVVNPIIPGVTSVRGGGLAN